MRSQLYHYFFRSGPIIPDLSASCPGADSLAHPMQWPGASAGASFGSHPGRLGSSPEANPEAPGSFTRTVALADSMLSPMANVNRAATTTAVKVTNVLNIREQLERRRI